jgi:hypothetical protein
MASGDRNGAYTHPESICKGSKTGHAKLTEEQVIKIRDTYFTGLYTQTVLANIYQVTQGAIWRIVRRRNWKHI